MLLKNTNRGNTIHIILSAILDFYAVPKINFALGWLCFVPLFIVLQRDRNSIRYGTIFGTALSLLLFSWMIPGAQRFTGSGIIYGILVWLVSTLLFSIFWILLFSFFSFLQ